jgi:phosphoribosyl-ATP pyrophosphohydrolase
MKERRIPYRRAWTLAPGARTAVPSPDYSNGSSADATAAVLEELHGALGRVTAAEHPRTYKLLRSSRRKLARKLIEEACEVTVEVVKRDARSVVSESADLLYQLVVLWFCCGIEPREIWREMQTRAATLGIAEKLPKAFDQAFDLDALSIDPEC